MDKKVSEISFTATATATTSKERAHDAFRDAIVSLCQKLDRKLPKRATVYSLDGSPIVDIVDGTAYRVVLHFD